jgi:hypothetical protein
MIRSFFTICLIALASSTSFSQILKGKITSESGEPIPYATVYIQELRQGTTANTKGDYELKLAAGKYLVTYQSLGYAQLFYNIIVTDREIIKNVALPLQYYQIPEVRITASGEDPAYGIMRKAIGMAPYYLNYVNYYKAEVYLKGNLIINKIPKIFQKAINVEARKDEEAGISSTKVKEGDAYIMESVNELEFTAPDKFNQRVISINSTFPDQGDNVSPMDFINASFYQPLVADIAISPLSPQAFSYYKFRYQGATLQGNNTINKIQVIPRMKSQQLFEGTIYIIEDLWCLQSVDLVNENMAGKINIQQLYIPVQDDIWMPVSHKFKMEISILGVKADAGYGSSVKYIEVKPNAALKKPEPIKSDYYVKEENLPAIPVSENQEKIEEILKKDELKNRDMVKLSRLMEKETAQTKPDSIRKNLEIKDNTTNTVEKDANKKDSTYWAEIRPIPLSDVELRSIRIRDSIKYVSSLQTAKTDTLQKIAPKKKSKFGSTINDICFGHTWSDTTGFSFAFEGLFDLDNLSFNTVDGFVYGFDFRLSRGWKNKTSLVISPEVKWAFSREEILARLNGTYSFNRMKQQQIFLRTGITSKDVSNGGSINPLLNSISSLFFENNYLKLYEAKFLNLGFRSEIANGLRIEISGGYENRNTLVNTTSFAFVNSKNEYSVNLPVNEYLDLGSNPINALRDQNHFEIVTNVTYTPRQKYSIYNGAKVSRGSEWPTFKLSWNHGINEFTELTDKYKNIDMLSLEIYKSRNIGGFSELRWSVGTGGYLNNTYVSWYDFFHFNSQPMPVLLDDYRDSFQLPAYYSLSTPEFYGEAHLKYTTPYLLLKYIPGLSKTLMRENLSLNYLGSRFHKSYTEIGYSISEISFFGELGVWVGFENLKYKSIGAKLILKLN